MLHLLLSAALAPLLVSADVPLAVGTQLNFRGAVEAAAEGPGKGGKAFDLTLWITQKSETGAEIFWLVDERGRGEFPWSERFGRMAVLSLPDASAIRSRAALPAALTLLSVAMFSAVPASVVAAVCNTWLKPSAPR